MFQATLKKDANKTVLHLSGRFNFESHVAFKQAYTPLLDEKDINTLSIDLSDVNYMDSSALGMLLMVRDKLAGKVKTILLSNSSGPVRNVLEVANFGKIFRIE